MSTIQEYVQHIYASLADVLDEHQRPAELYDPIRYLFEGGGKRIRPVLVLLAAEAVGGSTSSAMPAALAVELLHNFTLVHDDIMDRSPLRRGRPTVHVEYNENTAILSGDVMLGIALRLVAQSAPHAANPAAVHDAFARGFIDVCEGQAMDMAFIQRSDVSLDEYFQMIERKTARLLETCVVMGGMIGHGSTRQLEALRTFARDLGVAFQMQDDILDLEGSEEFGKTPGGDLIEGKRTWLMLRARDVSKTNGAKTDGENCRPLINEFFANGGITPEHVPELRRCLIAMGVVNEARSIVKNLTDDAFTHLHLLPDTEARGLLEELAQSLMKRST